MQKSKLAGTIRGSYFAFKNDYCSPPDGLSGSELGRSSGLRPQRASERCCLLHGEVGVTRAFGSGVAGHGPRPANQMSKLEEPAS
jgi:hypothetical protein